MRRRSLVRSMITWGVTGILLLGGCSASNGGDGDTETSGDGIQYGVADGEKLMLNACLPEGSDGPSAAVILIHGGGFEEGNRNSGGMTELCGQLAENGVAGFSVDYRLAPEFAYPAAVDDVSTAVRWLREPEQVSRFGIDPTRIGLLGSSAGAIIAASVGTAGEGDTGTGSRVAAVVALSPAADLTEKGLQLGSPADDEVQLILQYLGCEEITECPEALAASALYSVDPTDPPFYIAVSDGEIVPEEQATALADALRGAGVVVELEVEDGEKHGIQLLDTATTASVRDFFRTNLVDRE